VKLPGDGTHGGVPPGRCSRAMAHRRRRAARLIARGYRLAGGAIPPPGLHKTEVLASPDPGGELGTPERNDPGLQDTEDLGKPAEENEGSADSGSESGTSEQNTSGPMDTDSGTDDDKELYLYEAMMIQAEGIIYGMSQGTYTVEELYCMIRDANPTLEDMVEEREEYGETVTEAIGKHH
jgi:hypothetical protein